MQTTFVKPRVPRDRGSSEEQASKQLRVAVSGFGPFRNIPVNPSWQCLKPLQGVQLRTASGHRVILDCTEVPTVYENVEKYTSKQHAEQTNSNGQPFEYDFHLHVGVAALQPGILLERRARRMGYAQLDALGCPAPGHPDNPDQKGFGLSDDWKGEDLPDRLQTTLPVERIQAELSTKWGSSIQISSNPGLYLCEYIYYSSLANANKMARMRNQDPKPVLFLHIPAVPDQKHLDDITEAVKDVICTVIDSLAE